MMVREIDQAEAESLAHGIGDAILVRALKPAAGATTIAAFDGAELLGAASYRHTKRGLKIANISVTRKRNGIGRALFEALKAKSADGAMWCQSAPDAKDFYEAMGMHAGEVLPDGRTIYRAAA